MSRTSWARQATEGCDLIVIGGRYRSHCSDGPPRPAGLRRGSLVRFALWAAVRLRFRIAQATPDTLRPTASGGSATRSRSTQDGRSQRVREYAPDDKLRDTHQLRLGLNPSCRTLLAERARRKEIPEPDQADSSSPALFEKIFRFSPAPNHL